MGAFAGDLSKLPLADVFQSIHQNRMTGALVIRSGSEHVVAFESGFVIGYVGPSAGASGLAADLVRRRVVHPRDIPRSTGAFRRKGALKRILIKRKVLDSGRFQLEARSFVFERVCDCFLLERGSFDFLETYEDKFPDTEQLAAGVRISVGEIVIEAIRRIDEWNRFREAVPSLDEVYVAAREPAEDEEACRREVLTLTAEGSLDVNGLLESIPFTRFATCEALRQLVLEDSVRIATGAEYLELGQAAEARGELEVAARVLTRGLERDPTNKEIALARIGVLEHLGLDAQVSEACSLLAKQLRERGDTTGAAEQFDRLTRLGKSDVFPLEALLEIRIEQERIAAVRSTAAALIRAYLKSDDPEKARQICSRLLTEFPGDRRIRVLHATTLAKLDAREEAGAVYREIAQEQLGNGDLEDAAHYLERALEVFPDDAKARQLLGEIKRGSHSEARLRRRRALALAAMFALASSALGWVTYEALGLARLRELHGGLVGSGPEAVREAIVAQQAVARDYPGTQAAAWSREASEDLQRSLAALTAPAPAPADEGTSTFLALSAELGGCLALGAAADLERLEEGLCAAEEVLSAPAAASLGLAEEAFLKAQFVDTLCLFAKRCLDADTARGAVRARSRMRRNKVALSEEQRRPLGFWRSFAGLRLGESGGAEAERRHPLLAGLRALIEERWEQSLPSFEEAAAEPALRGLALLGSARALLRLGRSAEAEAAFQDAAEASPPPASLRRRRADAYLAAGDVGRAHATYLEALRAHPRDALAARRYQATAAGDLDDASLELERLAAGDQGALELQVLAVASRLLMGDDVEERLDTLCSQSAHARLLRADLAAARGADDPYAALRGDGLVARAARARWLVERGRLDEAKVERDAIASELRAPRDVPPGPRVARGVRDLGWVRLATGDAEGAARDARDALRGLPGDLDALALLVRREPEARPVWSAALWRELEQLDGALPRGILLCRLAETSRRQGLAAKAARLLEARLAMGSGVFLARHYLERALHAQGKATAVAIAATDPLPWLEELGAVEGAHPVTASQHEAAALLYERTRGRKVTAQRQILREALVLDPGSADVRRALALSLARTRWSRAETLLEWLRWAQVQPSSMPRVLIFYRRRWRARRAQYREESLLTLLGLESRQPLRRVPELFDRYLELACPAPDQPAPVLGEAEALRAGLDRALARDSRLVGLLLLRAHLAELEGRPRRRRRDLELFAEAFGPTDGAPPDSAWHWAQLFEAQILAPRSPREAIAVLQKISVSALRDDPSMSPSVLAWLRSEPAFAGLHEHQAFVAFVDALDR